MTSGRLHSRATRRFGELYEMVHRREASRPNALWQADHAQLDILLLREDGSAGRPWLTAVIDDYTRSIAGYFSASTRLRHFGPLSR